MFNASRGSFLSSGFLSAWDRMKILTFNRVLVRLETEKEKKMSRVERFSRSNWSVSGIGNATEDR